MSKSKIMPSIEDVNHLKIPLQHILFATNRFHKENLIGAGGFGPVYKGISEKLGCIAIKRLVRRQRQGQGQGDHEFKTEIALLSKYKHENIVSLLGFCDEDGEKMLVYRFESNGSLDRHLNNQDLPWIQRLHICLDAARGLKYLHDNVGRSQLRIFHRDVKSSNILLDVDWKAKISDFGLSRTSPGSFVITIPCGTHGYIDPDYYMNGYLTQKSDVYSFGVVLWEVMCGRLPNITWYNDDRRILTVLVQKHYKRGTLDRIIPSYLHKQMNKDSLHTFSNIAYQCLKNVEERPTMKQVVEQLQLALDHQLGSRYTLHKEVKQPEEARKVEEEVKPAAGDKRNVVDLKDPSSGQEIVLSTYMHCEDCARKVRRCLKGFEGVESVVTVCETSRVIVKGEKADPSKVLKRLMKKIDRKVELLSPVLKPPAEAAKTPELEEPSKGEEKKYEVKKPEDGEKREEETKHAAGYEKKVEKPKDPPSSPRPQVVVLSVFLHCVGCAEKVRKHIQAFEGVESVVTNLENSQVVVKGTFPATELVEYVFKKTQKETVIVKQDHT